MTNSNAVKAKRNTAPHPGQFQKGDPRINRRGQMNKRRIEFNKTIRELLVDEGEALQSGKIGDSTVKLKKVAWLMKSVWNKAIAGEAWAVQFIAERVEGKIIQPIGGEVNIKHNFEMVMTEFFTEHGTCTVEEFVKQLKSINGGGNGGGDTKLLAKSVAKLPPAKPD